MITDNATVRQDRFQQEAMIHRGWLMGAALRLTKSRPDAEDLVQETLLKAYRSFGTYEKNSNCRAWLFKIMTNANIDRYKQFKLIKILSFDDSDSNFLEAQMVTEPRAADPERELFYKLFESDIRSAIEQLTDTYRIVVILSFFDGCSEKEISQITGLRMGTVKSRLHRGRRLLQKSLWKYAKVNPIPEDRPMSYPRYVA